jgi:hypothetical protein
MPRVNGATRKPVGPWSPNQVRLIADTVNAILEGRDAGPNERGAQFRAFLARITGATARAGLTKAWLYDWQECFVNEAGAYVTAANTRRRSSQITTYGPAINGNEGPQTIGAGTILGPGITAALIPAGYSYNAIANDTVVLMYAGQRTSGSPLFWFYAANPIDGECSASFTGGGGGGLEPEPL